MTSASSSTPYARLGGAPVVRRLVDRLYYWVATRPQAHAVHAMHRNDMTVVKARLAAFLSGFLGGPDLYRPAYGEPAMCRRHAPFAIGPVERDEWMRCFDRALDEVVDDRALRDEVSRAVAAMAERIRDRAANGGGACGGPACGRVAA